MKDVISPFVSTRTIADASMAKARAMAEEKPQPHHNIPPELNFYPSGTKTHQDLIKEEITKKRSTD